MGLDMYLMDIQKDKYVAYWRGDWGVFTILEQVLGTIHSGKRVKFTVVNRKQCEEIATTNLSNFIDNLGKVSRQDAVGQLISLFKEKDDTCQNMKLLNELDNLDKRKTYTFYCDW